MAEFLDKTGLAYFWKKLQSYVQTSIHFQTDAQFDNVDIALRKKADSADVNKIVTYKTVKRKNYKINTTDNVGVGIKKNNPQFTESIPSGYYIVPLHARYIYYASESDYNNNVEASPIGYLVSIYAPEYLAVAKDDIYNIYLKASSSWTEYGGYWEIECLLVKKPYTRPKVG